MKVRNMLRWQQATPVLFGLLAAFQMHPALADGVMVTQTSALVPGSVREISVGPDGLIWALSNTSNGSATTGVKNYTIHRWNNSRGDWDTIPGGAFKIAAAPGGLAWVISAQGVIWRWNTSKQNWDQMPGGGSDVAVGAEGSVYVVGGAPAPGLYDNPIYKWNGSAWDATGGCAMHLAVEPLGTAWALSSNGRMWRKFPDSRVGFAMVPGGLLASSLSIGAAGHVWAVDAVDTGGGNNSPYQWDGIKWVKTSGQVVRVGVEPDGRPWFLTAAGAVYRGVPQTIPVLMGAVTPPPPPATVVPPATAIDDDICWKNTATRGVGKVPSYCPAGSIPDETGLLCYKACNAGYNGVGPVCWDFPKSYGRGWGSIKDGCGIGNEYDAGLCYPSCPPATSGVGPVCWGTCGGKYPVECGAACAASSLQCGKAIVNIVTSISDSVVSIVGMVATAGASTAAILAARTAAKAAAKGGAKAALKAAMKELFIQKMKEQARDIVDGEVESLATSAVENYLQSAAGGEPGFDPTTLDPTGISAVVQAFNKPICDPQSMGTVIAADPLTSTNTTVFAIDNANQLWANAGWAWYKVPGTADGTTNVSVGQDGSLWRTDASGRAKAWNGQSWDAYGGAVTFKSIATGGGKNVWAVGNDGKLYKFTGRDFRPMGKNWNLTQVSVSISGEIYVVDATKTAYKWFEAEQLPSKVFGPQLNVPFNVSAMTSTRVLALSYAGEIMNLDGGNIASGFGNSPQGVRQVAGGGSGEIWFLNSTGQPGRVVKWVKGAGNLAASIDHIVFDTNTFKQIAIR